MSSWAGLRSQVPDTLCHGEGGRKLSSGNSSCPQASYIPTGVPPDHHSSPQISSFIGALIEFQLALPLGLTPASVGWVFSLSMQPSPWEVASSLRDQLKMGLVGSEYYPPPSKSGRPWLSLSMHSSILSFTTVVSTYCMPGTTQDPEIKTNQILPSWS